MKPDLSGWGATLLRPLPGGARSRLWLCERAGSWFVARAVHEGETGLRWQDRVQAMAGRCGMTVARMVPAASGAFARGGVVLEPFLVGTPAHGADLAALAPGIARLHRATRDWPQRPGYRAAMLPHGLAARLPVPLGRVAVVHGDLHPGNLLRLPTGRLALIDWEEARVDAARLDRMALAQRPSLAAEVVACWHAEPARARRLARRAMAGATAPA